MISNGQEGFAFSATQASAGGVGNYWGYCGNTVTFTVPNTGVYVDLTGSGNYVLKTATFSVGGDYPTFYDPNYYHIISWSGLSASNPVTGTAPEKSKLIRYKATSSSTQIFDVNIIMPAVSVAITYIAGQGSSSHYLNRAPQQWSLGATGALRTTGPNKELFLALLNKTGSNLLLGWGDKMLQLAPGGNIIRYDGPVDEKGRPSVGPSDFNGALVTGSDGKNYVVGVLESSTVNPGGYAWHAPSPSAYPTAPAPGGDQIRVTDGATGPVIGMTHSNGGADYIVLPTGMTSAASNTGGGTAVLSDPTQPKPVQTTSNSTSNSTTSNTTNNSNVSNTTIINNNSTPSVAAALAGNEGGANAISYDASGDLGDSSGTPSGDLKGKLDSTRSAINTTFGANSFKLLSQGTIPKVTTYPFIMNLGSWGTISRTVDFSQTPFPEFRAACLVVMTFGLGNSLMKRLTI